MATTDKLSKEIIPDVSLFDKLGARSRAFPMVITELVDNSLDSWVAMPDSKKKGKTLTVEITASEAKDAWFVIKDNAGGMTQDELIDAMTVARSNKTKGFLGHFGFGLKSAAMYIGGRFRVYSMSYKDPKVVNYVEFDKEKFRDKGEWRLDFQTISANEATKIGVTFKDGHGTEIRVRNDRYKSANKKGILRKLQRTFAPRLQKNPKLKLKFGEPHDEMNIYFNDESVQAAGPFYEVWDNSVKKVEDETKRFLQEVKRDPRHSFDVTTDFIKGQQKEAAVIPQPIEWLEEIPSVMEIPEIKINGKAVWGRIGILDRGMAHNNEYGFDLIKYGRIIEANVLDKETKKTEAESEEEGGKPTKNRDIGFNASNHNARIVGQLYLDSWDTDHQKTSFIKDNEDWSKLTEHVAKHVKKLLHISSLLQHPRKHFEKLNIKDENAPEVIADKRFEEKLPSLNKGVQKAARSSNVKSAITNLESSRKKEDSKKSQEPKVQESTTKLMATKTEIHFTRKGENSAMVLTKVKKDRDNNILEITLNRDHPFLAKRESMELNAIGEFVAIDFFASYVMSNKSNLTHDDFIKLRDTLLRELSLRK